MSKTKFIKSEFFNELVRLFRKHDITWLNCDSSWIAGRRFEFNYCHEDGEENLEIEVRHTPLLVNCKEQREMTDTKDQKKQIRRHYDLPPQITPEEERDIELNEAYERGIAHGRKAERERIYKLCQNFMAYEAVDDISPIEYGSIGMESLKRIIFGGEM